MLHKRLDYGFNGYQVPSIPRATRSARKRGSSCKKTDDKHMSAIDVLATVVGKLLVEGEDFTSSTDKLTGKEQHAVVKDVVKKEQGGEDNTLEVKQPCDQGSCNKTFFVSELLSQAPIVNLHAHNDACSGFASVITTSDCKLEDKNKNRTKIEPPTIGKVSISERADKCSLEDPFVCDEKPPALLSSDNSVKFPCGDHSPRGSFPVCRDNLKLVRDDDESSSGCTRPSTLNKASRPPSRIGDRRIRKIIASKYWKVSPKLKDEERFSSDTEPKHVNCDRKNCYKRQRSFRDFPFKKRKLYNCGSVSNCDEGVSSDGLSKGPSGDSSGLGATTYGATKTSAFAAGQRKFFQSKDSQVKLKIKSLRVPELYIEIPETATVGSLKRKVMEAVTAILSGGLRVGVLVQGKKIRDDSKTLLQTGISHDNKLDALGFTLEPNPSQIPPPICPEDNFFLPPCETPQPLARYPPTPRVVQKGTYDAFLESPVTNFGNLIESDHDSAPSPPDSRMDKSTTDLRALVAVPTTNRESLAMVPMQKSQRSDMGLRRIRRPFSVSEVEALVQAVEKLGTGRWRDVKLRAFDNAKHRTYVDLKDKWKTLVHTARISPQQRRGEPVPQELLDRVLTAHAYWSHHQAKQQLKHQSEACVLLS